MRRFRELTMGHAVVMGRKTWDSLPDRFRPLPGRRNIVVTRNDLWRGDGAERAGSLEDALALLEDADRVFVIGGGELYAAALPLADELLLTEIDLEMEGDTFFPAWERVAFEERSRDEQSPKPEPHSRSSPIGAGVRLQPDPVVRSPISHRGQAEA